MGDVPLFSLHCIPLLLYFAQLFLHLAGALFSASNRGEETGVVKPWKTATAVPGWKASKDAEVSKMMKFALKTMNFVLKMMKFVFNDDEVCI